MQAGLDIQSVCPFCSTPETMSQEIYTWLYGIDMSLKCRQHHHFTAGKLLTIIIYGIQGVCRLRKFREDGMR